MLCRLEKDSVSVAKVIEGFDSHVTSIHKTGDSSTYIIGTADNGLFHLKISDKSENLHATS